MYYARQMTPANAAPEMPRQRDCTSVETFLFALASLPWGLYSDGMVVRKKLARGSAANIAAL
jgi:hypothetical protein